MAKLQDEIEAQGLWDLDTQVEQALDALRCPPGDAEVDEALGRREAARGADQAAAGQARHPAARRADQPSRRRVRRLAGALSQGVCRLHHAGDARPLLPRQHHASGRWSSIAARACPTRATTRAGWSRRPSASRSRRARRRPSSARSGASWNGSGRRPRRGRPSPRRASRPTTSSPRRPGREEAGKAQIQIPPGPRLGGMVVEVEGLSKAFGDRLLIDDLSFKLPPGGIVGVIGPNGAGKTTLFKMITGPGEAGRRHDPARRQRQARLRRPEPRPPRRQEDRVGGDVGRARHHEARRQDGGELAAPTSAGSTSRGRTSRRRWGCCRAASATACISPRC